MKVCKQCKAMKELSQFRKTKSGYGTTCKQCYNDNSAKYFKTKQGIVARIYNKQKSSSRIRGHACPLYSCQELREWMFSKSKFHKIFNLWESLNYEISYAPSIDRIDDNKGYSFDNIQILTWEENKKKAYKGIMSGEIITQHKTVNQYTKKGVFLKSFISIGDASRKININRWNISSCCSGRRKSSGGYVWEYA